ncbi:MAG: class I SAM-dependent methyltransferase [Rhodobiaceae bacterium]|nr:class I SAM-dependent methyltransferase [Rhodobiaceae bacterium]
MKKPQFIARQGRQPSGLLGSIIGRIMSKETAAANDIAIALLKVSPGDRVLDVGTGHGAALATLAALNDPGSLDGLDFSPTALKIARKRNSALLRSGRLHLHQGASNVMPYADESFDKILTMHTIYFWEEAATHLAEVFRVLAPGGRFVIGFRPGDDTRTASIFPDNVYAFRTIEDVKILLEEAGFSIAETERQDDRKSILSWIAAEHPR